MSFPDPYTPKLEYRLLESRLAALRDDIDRIHQDIDKCWITVDRVFAALDILRVTISDADRQAELEMMSKDEFERMLIEMLGDEDGRP